MEMLSLKRLADAIGADCPNPVVAEKIFIDNVCTDTRKLQPGCLFIAIKGERFDGHDFIPQAIEGGAAGIISSVNIEGRNDVILVEDTRKALLKLAKFYKSLFNVFTVGVTGSVGKTSTKEMIYAILSFQEKTLKTQGNFNNEIGLPMTCFELDSSYKNAVFEMGMSDFGEIDALSDVCRPTVGVITNIGVSHIEILGSRENILKAKLEITNHMPHDAPLILNADDDMLKNVNISCENPVITYGIEEAADVTASDLVTEDNETHFVIHFYGKTINAVIPTIGKHNVYNALAGFCVGLVADKKPETIVKAMQLYQNAGLRQHTTVENGVTVIADCYNASPVSMSAALDVITNIQCTGKRVCVFGDMLELGSFAEEAHLEVGRSVARTRVDALLCYGEAARDIKRGAVMVGMKNVHHFEDKEQMAKCLFELLKPGDVVIFKASRGIKLEDAIKSLRELWGQGTL